MSLCTSIENFIQATEKKTETMISKSREAVIANLKIVRAHQLLRELRVTDKKEVIVDIRNEFKRLYFEENYVGAENAQIVKDFDRTDSTILF